VDSLGWAEERMEELQLKKEANLTNVHGQELKINMVVNLIREIHVLLKIVVVVICVLCALCFIVVVVLKK
jgi:hypothetical protein